VSFTQVDRHDAIVSTESEVALAAVRAADHHIRLTDL